MKVERKRDTPVNPSNQGERDCIQSYFQIHTQILLLFTTCTSADEKIYQRSSRVFSSANYMDDNIALNLRKFSLLCYFFSTYTMFAFHVNIRKNLTPDSIHIINSASPYAYLMYFSRVYPLKTRVYAMKAAIQFNLNGKYFHKFICHLMMSAAGGWKQGRSAMLKAFS